MSAITKEPHGKPGKTLSPQCAELLNHLQKRGSITGAEAFRFLGIYRLSARIWDLRDAGYNIQTQMVERINRRTQTVHVAKYTLAKGPVGTQSISKLE